MAVRSESVYVCDIDATEEKVGPGMARGWRFVTIGTAPRERGAEMPREITLCPKCAEILVGIIPKGASWVR